MKMTFKQALEHAIATTGRAKSWREVAVKSGVSYDILKNVKQDKSEKPNAADALKIAEFFRVSLEMFYSGQVTPISDAEAEAIADDAEKVTGILKKLKGSSRAQVKDFAAALLQIEEASQQTE